MGVAGWFMVVRGHITEPQGGVLWQIAYFYTYRGGAGYAPIILRYTKTYMKVLITRHIPEAGLQLMRSNDLELTVMKGKPSKSAIIRELKGNSYDGMVTLLTDRIDTEVFNAVGSNMRVIANYAVGYNNIMIDEAGKRGIVVTNTPGVLTETVAEHTAALIFAAAARVVEADEFVRNNRFTGWEPELFLGIDLHDKTLGILGAGRIGTRVAEIMKGVNMNIIYYDVRANSYLEEKTDAKQCAAPEDVLRQADVISLHLPLNDSTHHFLNEDRLSLLKKTAILVNTSRGAVIDEKMLTAKLLKGDFFGAALDVFEDEPNISRTLRRLPNVILTPHTASASIATRNRMAEIAANNVIAVLHGAEPPNPVQ